MAQQKFSFCHILQAARQNWSQKHLRIFVVIALKIFLRSGLKPLGVFKYLLLIFYYQFCLSPSYGNHAMEICCGRITHPWCLKTRHIFFIFRDLLQTLFLLIHFLFWNGAYQGAGKLPFRLSYSCLLNQCKLYCFYEPKWYFESNLGR